MSTEKLYYSDSHMSSFTACVTNCEAQGESWRVSLERTAFFPEGGGQAADTGFIGQARVLDVHEKNGEIWHYTDKPLEACVEYSCALDREQRLRRMQNHSGEHVVSGIIHTLYGFENVGFHMGDECMTIDLSGELTWEQLTEVENRANKAVRENLPISATFPEPSVLAGLEYRSKLDLKSDVRIVEIEGIDRCACCAPHVAHTGEIGLIKLIDAVRHRGGVRVSLVCGMDALEYIRLMQNNITAISSLLSAKREETAQAVERLLREQQRSKERIGALGMELVRVKADAYPQVEGNICIFDNDLDEVALRELVNALSAKCTGMAAAFSGSDEQGYKYIVGSRHIDLRTQAKELNQGRGGGSAEMLRGSVAAPAQLIQEFVESACV